LSAASAGTAPLWVLAVDTATDVYSVALVRGPELVAEFTACAPRRHAERLHALLQHVLAEAGILLPAVDVFGVSSGPGSFTGLRIGVSAMKGLAFACGKPLIAVNTLDALAHTVPPAFPDLVAMLDARMHEVYAATYAREAQAWRRVGAPQVGAPGPLAAQAPPGACFVGDGIVRYADEVRGAAPAAVLLGGYHATPRAGAVALLAVASYAAGAPGDPGSVTPLYLRQSQPEEARHRAASP